MMLREISNVRQVNGEPKRRWFFCHEIDLFVWEDRGGVICGFQLAYDKYRRERSFVWQEKRGFAHYSVDDGEPLTGVNRTPLLYTDGPFERGRVLERFLALSREMPADIVGFVTSKLHEYQGAVIP